MTRTQFEHIIRAASTIIEHNEIVTVGSQAILGQFPNPPAQCRRSMELDVFTMRAPSDADLIDGSIGEESPFHRTFGYWAHGIGIETVILPADWRSRAIRTSNANTLGSVAISPEVHDLAVSKLAAGREKDLEYVRALIVVGLCQAEVIADRIALVDTSDGLKKSMTFRLARCQSDPAQME